jgi:hypothetical protein
MKSVTKLMAEFAYLWEFCEQCSMIVVRIYYAYHVCIRGKQRGSLKKSVVVQNAWTGTHIIIELKTAHSVQMIVTPIMP